HRGVMGTLHANSARETLVRLTSPPINVPLSMLSSLNLIIMQNRIHDRRKGTLRRITEIAELVPSEDLSMPQLQILYQWDPVTDKLNATGLSSFYLELLSKYAGLAVPDLMAQVGKRADALKALGDQGIRSLSEVSQITQNYLASARFKV
ncbi:MAG: hypothetical protein Q8P02_01700, partial [Candidatus Micrarchaeota archaeon]|nr:hypothetical protein [Candidatus Micrarchaeota archaeon]